MLGISMTVNQIESNIDVSSLLPDALCLKKQEQIQIGQLLWRLDNPADIETLAIKKFDWLNPAQIPDAKLIKKNAQREVWFININGCSCYAKYYLRNGTFWQIKKLYRGPACIKEWSVARYAITENVNCVRPLAYALSTNPNSKIDCLLITAGETQTLPLAEYWEQTSKQTSYQRFKQQNILIDAIAELLARAHHSGLAHSDLHPGNLLVEYSNANKPKVYLVDLHSIQIAQPVSDRDAIYNLAQLNQWFRQHASVTQRLKLLKRYMYYRFQLSNKQNKNFEQQTFRYWAKALDRAAEIHTKRIWASRDRRVNRTSKYFAKLRLPNNWRANVFLKTKHPLEYSPSSNLEFTPEDWRKALQNPEQMLENFVKQARPFKNSRSALVCKGKLKVGQHELNVVAKRNIRKKIFATLWDCLRNSRALKAWKMSFAMIHRGIPVAQPLAVLERRIGPVLVNSIFITETVEPAVNLRIFLTSILPVLTAKEKRNAKIVLIEKLATIIKKMHINGFSHRDMKASNILIRNISIENPNNIIPENMQIILVDLDGLKLKRRTSEKDQLRALARLSISADLSPYITLADRVRFLKQYMQRIGSGKPNWKKLWYDIQIEREKRFHDHLAG